MSNLLYSPAVGIETQTWTTGLDKYTQSNCQVALTHQGYHIYRPPNVNPTNNGNTMWGGLRLINSSNANINHTYDINVDNIFGLIQGHTYIIVFHVKGKSNNTFVTYNWINQMGWGGGGLQPAPTNIISHGIPANFNGEDDCFYKFTISDTIAKTCTTTYSYATAGNTYLSYNHFGVGFDYSDTGAMGTDIYITNLRMYDITNNPSFSVNKQGQALPIEVVEIEKRSQGSILKSGNILCNSFYEY